MERRRPIIPVDYFPSRKYGHRNPPNLSQKRQLATVNQQSRTAPIVKVKRTRNAPVDRTEHPRQFDDLSPLIAEIVQPNRNVHIAAIEQRIENPVPIAEAQHSHRETQTDVVDRMENSRPYDAALLPISEIMQPNCAVGMHDAVQNHAHEVNVITTPSEQQAEPSPSILSLSQQVERFRCLVAKKDKQIELYQSTVKLLNEKLGAEDLTVEVQKHYGQILLSSAEGSSDSDDSGGENHDEEFANKENHASNVSNAPQTDMSFSFSHQFVLDVSTNVLLSDFSQIYLLQFGVFFTETKDTTLFIPQDRNT